MDIVKNIVDSLNEYVFVMSENIAKTYNLNLEDLLKIWCDQQNLNFEETFSSRLNLNKKAKKAIKSVTTQPPLHQIDASNICEPILLTPPEEDSNKTENNVKLEDAKGVQCEYIFSRGVKKNTRCHILTKTGHLCSKHKQTT